MPQHTYELPIACVEGWSTTQHWTGVRLADLAELVGAAPDARLRVESIQPSGPFRQGDLGRGAGRATRGRCSRCGVNGVELSLDHGYPARMILPRARRACTAPSGSEA